MSRIATTVVPALLLCALCRTASAEPEQRTPVTSWSPDEIAKFKTATVCHDVERDQYGIAAVFFHEGGILAGPRDEIYYLTVDGDSSSPTYGELLDVQFLDSAPRIDSVDCTSDDGSNVFVAYDRFGSDARWARIDGATLHGPYDVAIGGCNPKTHKPRIAYGDDLIMIAVEGWHYSAPLEYASCEVCTQQFDIPSGAPYPHAQTILWPHAGTTHQGYDVEWGDGAFVTVMAHESDNPIVPYLTAYETNFANDLDPETNLPPASLIQDFSDLPEPAFPWNVQLVRSQNEQNEAGDMFLKTEHGSYWLDASGAPRSAPLDDPRMPVFATCEYWGADPASAHLFSRDTYFEYVGNFPDGELITYPQTVRDHYGLSRDYPYETFDVMNELVPIACDGANTYDDPEVMLVSSVPAGADGLVYWSIQGNDD